MKQRPNVCYFLSDIEKQISYDQSINQSSLFKVDANLHEDVLEFGTYPSPNKNRPKNT